MIKFDRFVLDNGLKVIIHEDPSSPMVAVNMTYNVGSKNEEPDKTGFAHLFEHLMFGGSANVPDFDAIIQEAGGENNAFTNSDMTSFYDVLPAQNLEAALWLESDRMMHLNISKKVLDTQKKVVIEEFKETSLNEPYGDMWHHLSRMAYKVHPYSWPTIGKEINHISNATLEQVSQFFSNYYRPGNAVLTIAGNIKSKETIELVRKWFEDIPAGKTNKNLYLPEPNHVEITREDVYAEVPHDAIFMAYNMGNRLSHEYYACDLITDLLANGTSSRFYKKLYKEKEYFSTIDAYITGSIDPGLLIIEGKLMPGISIDTARQAILDELEILKEEPVPKREFQKLKNTVETSLIFGEVSILNKAMSLGYFEIVGDAALINSESDRYMSVTAQDIMDTARKLFKDSNCTELIYRRKTI